MSTFQKIFLYVFFLQLNLNKVEFLGLIPNDKLIEYYNDAKIVVVPSRWPEPHARVIVEAMLRGCTVVASKPGGSEELILHKKNGLLFHSRDIKELVTFLNFLLRHPQESSKMSQLAALGIRRKYQLGSVIVAHEQFYHQIISNYENNRQV